MTDMTAAESRQRIAWLALLGALSVEVLGGLALLVPSATGMLDASDEPLGARLSVFVALLLAWVWVCATLLGAVRSRANWVRGSSLTIHVLLFAAGTGMLQIGLGSQLLAWGMIVLAVVGFVAVLLTRPTIEPDPAELG